MLYCDTLQTKTCSKLIIKTSKQCLKFGQNPAGIYLLKVNNINTRTRSEKCSKSTIKTLERHQWHHSVVFIVNKYEEISHPLLVFLLLTCIYNYVLAGWEVYSFKANIPTRKSSAWFLCDANIGFNEKQKLFQNNFINIVLKLLLSREKYSACYILQSQDMFFLQPSWSSTFENGI